ncbi:MAG: putative hydro-lyase [Deferrisomatales bacterium]|nr:putative hydro-lyase [Deferrisomatales bacterium]
MLETNRLPTGRDVRDACRRGELTGPTAGLAPGYGQANLVVVPQEAAEDFAAFCERNPRPCPLLERTGPGGWEPRRLAPGADLRTDLPRYRVLREGRCTARPTDILSLWREDFVAFLLGCSFTFEAALLDAGVPVRHLEEGRNVPMFRTSLACVPAGPFRGPLVVSMRPMPPEQAARAAEITARHPHFHGAPVHVGDPGAIGVADLARPDYGDAVTVRPGEVPVFWACGVTPLEALLGAGLEVAATHEPGHMFVTDLSDRDLLGL